MMLILPLFLVGVARANLCNEKHKRPTIAIDAGERRLKQWDNKTFGLPYGEDLTLHCSAGSSVNLSIQNEESLQSLQTTLLNKTTIQLYVKKPDVGRYLYSCSDSNGCRNSLIVFIRPVVSATSPNIRQTQDAYGNRLFFVPLGEPFEIFCSGSASESLFVNFLEFYNFHRLPTRIVNSTTVQGEAVANYTTRKDCYCSSDYIESGTIKVLVDYYPDAFNFQCTIHHARRLECTWSTSSIKNYFRLYFAHDKDVILLCTDNFKEAIKGCSSITPISTGFLELQTCNQVFCVVEQFPYDMDLIVKLDPPTELKVSNLSSHSVILSWSNPNSGSVIMWNCVFRVEYRLLASAWQQANTSNVKCELLTCEFLLTLPCPASHYEARVYIKAKTAIGDRFWSEPVSVFFFTDHQSSGDVDPVCNSVEEESEPPLSREIILYKIRQLIRYEYKEKLLMKNKRVALEQKRARIKELAELIEKQSGVALP